jgi:hypothetical protein
MDQDVINKIMKSENREQTMKILGERRSKILQAIGDRELEPTDEVLGELFDLNVALGDADMFQDGEQ